MYIVLILYWRLFKMVPLRPALFESSKLGLGGAVKSEGQ